MAVRSLLFGIQAVDPRVIAASLALFLATALLAAGLPVRRAVRIDHTVPLRDE